MIKKIEAFFKLNGISTRDIKTELIEQYMSLYDNWNSKFSISSIKNRDEVLEKHFLDSFALDLILKDERVVDIGSGGGFPGLAYKIINPNISLVSLERNKKKISFQQRVASELGIEDVTFFDDSLENFSEVDNVDIYTMRAVERREQIFSWLSRNMGSAKAIYMSSENTPEGALEDDFEILNMVSYTLPESCMKRNLVLFKTK
jgi:16S rRNA (guanine527-N7)-methyltransferase